MQTVTLITGHQQNILGHWFAAVTSNGCEIKGSIIIASAMGVPQSYYFPIANWLGEQGYNVLTFDCVGIGQSKEKHLKEYQGNILDWAVYDYSAALQFILNKSSSSPIYWLGHSLGGQIFPLVKNIEQVSKVITIASGTGYWKHNVPALRKKAPLFWYIIMPIVTSLFRYFPGKKLGMIGDLPKNVMFQWRRWCLNPDYCVGAEAEDIKAKFQQLTVPLHSIGFADDEMLSLTNIRDLHELFGGKNKELKEVGLEVLAKHRVGHLGFFKEQFKHNLWRELLLPELNL